MRKSQAQARMFTKKQMDEQVAMEVSRARWRWNDEVHWFSASWWAGLAMIPGIAMTGFLLYLLVYCPLWWFVHNASAHPEEVRPAFSGGGVGGSTSGTWSGGLTCDYINGIYSCK